MTTFLGDDYLLTSGTGKKIFDAIKNLPILDAHNHANVKEIVENKNYTDIWQVEAATDHYVWELMRKRGVPERLITGDATTNEEKWMALASVFEYIAGNPTYEWIHLDLQRRFGITELVNQGSARRIWDVAKERLSRPEMRPQALLAAMGVEVMCSTDDPADALGHHEALARAAGAPRVRVLPTWRPDKSMNVFKKDFPDYVEMLAARVGRPITDIGGLVSALQETHDYFEARGCKASDHGIQVPFGYDVPAGRADEVFKKRLTGNDLDPAETRDYISYMMHQFAAMNSKSGWVMQIHVGAVRDYRDSLFEELGPDTGGDICDPSIPVVEPVKALLNAFDGKLKVVLFSLDPVHWPAMATIARAFGKDVSLGSAWWFNDSPVGMRRQLEYVGSVDLLANFAGMVTDSRKLMSYGSRTEMFRRVLADVLGAMVEKGQLPEALAAKLARHACYEGPKALFGF
ncbi:MAG: glucuronate isomerase [Candidatus Lokiarchaeota archaeon]|nr:glucuronate isomerase [Candidatus Lokiarchaeota archaeon]